MPAFPWAIRTDPPTAIPVELMSPVLRAASIAAVSFCVFAAAVEAAPSFANPAAIQPAVEVVFNDPQIINAPVEQVVPPAADESAPTPTPFAQPEVRHSSLRAMVDAQDTSAQLSREEECLAGTIYFESRSESLEGQHAVANVVINRAESGRFPGTICGVVYQPSQFSFVRGGRMPAISRSSADWREAVAIARIAMDDRWNSAAPDALFFHATRVSPRWRLKRVATVGNHVFYR